MRYIAICLLLSVHKAKPLAKIKQVSLYVKKCKQGLNQCILQTQCLSCQKEIDGRHFYSLPKYTNASQNVMFISVLALGYLGSTSEYMGPMTRVKLFFIANHYSLVDC